MYPGHTFLSVFIDGDFQANLIRSLHLEGWDMLCNIDLCCTILLQNYIIIESFHVGIYHSMFQLGSFRF